MTEQQTTEAAPVRVPNVSAGARSGLDHEVIGSNAQAAYDENQRLALNPETDPADVTEPQVGQDAGDEQLPAIPEDVTTVDELLAWVVEDGDESSDARARAALAAERAKPEDEQRVTLIEPLERHLAAGEDDSDQS